MSHSPLPCRCKRNKKMVISPPSVGPKRPIINNCNSIHLNMPRVRKTQITKQHVPHNAKHSNNKQTCFTNTVNSYKIVSTTKIDDKSSIANWLLEHLKKNLRTEQNYKITWTELTKTNCIYKKSRDKSRTLLPWTSHHTLDSRYIAKYQNKEYITVNKSSIPNGHVAGGLHINEFI